MKKLPKKFKEKWLAALRSGEFKQGRNGWMKEGDRYCCLGVAATICGAKIDDYHSKKFPLAIRGGFSNIATTRLIEMNDEKEYGFKRIANWIEKNL